MRGNSIVQFARGVAYIIVNVLGDTSHFTSFHIQKNKALPIWQDLEFDFLDYPVVKSGRSVLQRVCILSNRSATGLHQELPTHPHPT